jgi:hypothetical protein
MSLQRPLALAPAILTLQSQRDIVQTFSYHCKASVGAERGSVTLERAKAYLIDNPSSRQNRQRGDSLPTRISPFQFGRPGHHSPSRLFTSRRPLSCFDLFSDCPPSSEPVSLLPFSFILLLFLRSQTPISSLFVVPRRTGNVPSVLPRASPQNPVDYSLLHRVI